MLKREFVGASSTEYVYAKELESTEKFGTLSDNTTDNTADEAFSVFRSPYIALYIVLSILVAIAIIEIVILIVMKCKRDTSVIRQKVSEPEKDPSVLPDQVIQDIPAKDPSKDESSSEKVLFVLPNESSSDKKDPTVPLTGQVILIQKISAPEKVPPVLSTGQVILMQEASEKDPSVLPTGQNILVQKVSEKDPPVLPDQVIQEVSEEVLSKTPTGQVILIQEVSEHEENPSVLPNQVIQDIPEENPPKDESSSDEKVPPVLSTGQVILMQEVSEHEENPPVLPDQVIQEVSEEVPPVPPDELSSDEKVPPVLSTGQVIQDIPEENPSKDESSPDEKDPPVLPDQVIQGIPAKDPSEDESSPVEKVPPVLPIKQRHPVNGCPALCEVNGTIEPLPYPELGHVWCLVQGDVNSGPRYGYFKQKDLADNVNADQITVMRIDNHSECTVDKNLEENYDDLKTQEPSRFDSDNLSPHRNLIRVKIGDKLYVEDENKLQEIGTLPTLLNLYKWVFQETCPGSKVHICVCFQLSSIKKQNTANYEQYFDENGKDLYADPKQKVIIDCEYSAPQFAQLFATVPEFSFRKYENNQGLCRNVINGKIEFLPVVQDGFAWLVDSNGYYVYIKISNMEPWKDHLSYHTKYTLLEMGEKIDVGIPYGVRPLNYDGLSNTDEGFCTDNSKRGRNLMRFLWGKNSNIECYDHKFSNYNPSDMPELPEGYGWFAREANYMNRCNLYEIVCCQISCLRLRTVNASINFDECIYYAWANCEYIGKIEDEIVVDAEQSEEKIKNTNFSPLSQDPYNDTPEQYNTQEQLLNIKKRSIKNEIPKKLPILISKNVRYYDTSYPRGFCMVKDPKTKKLIVEPLPPEAQGYAWVTRNEFSCDVDSNSIVYVYMKECSLKYEKGALNIYHCHLRGECMADINSEIDYDSLQPGDDGFPTDENRVQLQDTTRLCNCEVDNIFKNYTDPNCTLLKPLLKLPKGHNWYLRKLEFSQGNEMMKYVCMRDCDLKESSLNTDQLTTDGTIVYNGQNGKYYSGYEKNEVMVDHSRKQKIRIWSKDVPSKCCLVDGKLEKLPPEATGFAWYFVKNETSDTYLCVYCKADTREVYSGNSQTNSFDVRYLIIQKQLTGYIVNTPILNYDFLLKEQGGYPLDTDKKSNFIRLVSINEGKCYLVTGQNIMEYNLSNLDDEYEGIRWAVRRSALGFEYVPIVIPQGTEQLSGYSFVHDVEDENNVTYNIVWENKHVKMSNTNEIVIDSNLIQREVIINKMNVSINAMFSVDLSMDDISAKSNSTAILERGLCCDLESGTVRPILDNGDLEAYPQCDLPIPRIGDETWQIVFQNDLYRYKRIRIIKSSDIESSTAVKTLHFAPEFSNDSALPPPLMRLGMNSTPMNIPIPRRAHTGCGWQINADNVLEEVPLPFPVPNNMLAVNADSTIWQVLVVNDKFVLKPFKIIAPQQNTLNSKFRWECLEVLMTSADGTTYDSFQWVWMEGDVPTEKLSLNEPGPNDIVCLTQGKGNFTVISEEGREKFYRENLFNLEYVPERFSVDDVKFYAPSVLKIGGSQFKENAYAYVASCGAQCEEKPEADEVWVLQCPNDQKLTKMKLSEIKISNKTPSCFNKIDREKIENYNAEINETTINVCMMYTNRLYYSGIALDASFMPRNGETLMECKHGYLIVPSSFLHDRIDQIDQQIELETQQEATRTRLATANQYKPNPEKNTRLDTLLSPNEPTNSTPLIPIQHPRTKSETTNTTPFTPKPNSTPFIPNSTPFIPNPHNPMHPRKKLGNPQ